MSESCHVCVTFVLVCWKTLYLLRYTGATFFFHTSAYACHVPNSQYKTCQPNFSPSLALIDLYTVPSPILVSYSDKRVLTGFFLHFSSAWLCLNIITRGFIILYVYIYIWNPSPVCVTSCIPTKFYAILSDLLPSFHISGSLTASCNSILAIHLVALTHSCTCVLLRCRAPWLYYLLYQVPALLLRLLFSLGFLWPSYKIFPEFHQ